MDEVVKGSWEDGSLIVKECGQGGDRGLSVVRFADDAGSDNIVEVLFGVVDVGFGCLGSEMSELMVVEAR